jgi:hypothetical protein
LNTAPIPAARRPRASTRFEAALAEVGRDAETYYPRRSVGPKQLDRTIELLRNASEGAS